jgi:hypothetical protein
MGLIPTEVGHKTVARGHRYFVVIAVFCQIKIFFENGT